METISSDIPTVTLNNGLKVPMLGFGTAGKEFTPESLRTHLVTAVVDLGYRLIDTASMYGNEETIGLALKDCFEKGIKREDLIVSTKLGNSEKDDIESALRRSLAKLQLDYVDIYLVHWILPKIDWSDEEKPIKNTPMHKVWAELERLCKAGLTKTIGVSNCTFPVMMDILTYCEIKPAINQIELHPYNACKVFVEYLRKLGVQVEAYGPLGSQHWVHKKPESQKLNILTDPTVAKLAEKYGKTTGQILLNWHTKGRGHITITKTTKIERLIENKNVFDFEMTQEEYDEITALDCGARSYDPIVTNMREFNYMPYYY